MSTTNSLYSSKAETAGSAGTNGVRTISPEKRQWIRQESEALLMKNLMMREKAKEDVFKKRMQHEKLQAAARDKRLNRWQEKTKHSPFAVNLVAEEERITEENTIRTKEENDRRRAMESRKEKAKNEIILKALSEFSDLEALRKEKRAIMEEEQRLKALLALEKVTVTKKADRLVAERATRQRKEAKLAHRRDKYKDSLDQIIEEERGALMKKHGVEEPTLGTGYWGQKKSSASTGSHSPSGPGHASPFASTAGANLGNSAFF